MNTEEVRIQIRNIEDRAYCMMYYNQKLRSARECRRIAIAKDNDVRRLLIEYASTKAEEELEKFMTTLDIKEDRKVIRKLRRYIIQYKQQ